ncbi:MAG: hypothetical protein SFX72_07950 [Isosphaeraceae bacterium]|nr:hypothetical protein [Isosphaeraceae bacterium]
MRRNDHAAMGGARTGAKARAGGASDEIAGGDLDRSDAARAEAGLLDAFAVTPGI